MKTFQYLKLLWILLFEDDKKIDRSFHTRFLTYYLHRRLLIVSVMMIICARYCLYCLYCDIGTAWYDCDSIKSICHSRLDVSSYRKVFAGMDAVQSIVCSNQNPSVHEDETVDMSYRYHQRTYISNTNVMRKMIRLRYNAFHLLWSLIIKVSELCVIYNSTTKLFRSDAFCDEIISHSVSILHTET